MRGKTVDPISWTRGISMSIVTMQPPPAAARRPAPNPPGPRPHPSGLAIQSRGHNELRRANSATLSRRQGEQMNDSHIFLLVSLYQRKSLQAKSKCDRLCFLSSGKARVPRQFG